MTTYMIVVDGELSDRFIASFGAKRLEPDTGRTSLTCEISDQAQLHGLLARIADLGLTLVSLGPMVSNRG